MKHFLSWKIFVSGNFKIRFFLENLKIFENFKFFENLKFPDFEIFLNFKIFLKQKNRHDEQNIIQIFLVTWIMCLESRKIIWNTLRCVDREMQTEVVDPYSDFSYFPRFSPPYLAQFKNDQCNGNLKKTLLYPKYGQS